MKYDRWTLGLAVAAVVSAALTLGIWIPNDIESGLVETFRRQTTIGDAMAPTMLAAGIFIVALAMGLISWLRSRFGYKERQVGLDRLSIEFLFRLAAIIVLGLLLIPYCGPLSVDLINALGGEIGSYRVLRDTVPYKYIGYFLGGFVMIFGIIWLIEQRPTRSAALVSLVAVIVLIVLYDLPFDDLLLPPNGDQ
jgi:hypothetical protein